ncbi:MAG TPA: redox-sensing transcriptional repressor Rex [Phycisphaerales bacterium]|nr:redox-sensing transcriptional repressor Rex [Phycisphaerales bacterium]HMP37525.1 redox-sensing transcriptional repressor Rex [Phycisphaerales bacterium]
MQPRPKIPRPTVTRLSLYLREIESRLEQGDATISSQQLGEALKLTDAQVRKDLAFFGQFGHPGVGYRLSELAAHLRAILGTDRQWNVALVGAGRIGRALMSYQRFRAKGFEIVAVFDNDTGVVGDLVAGHRVRPLSDMPQLFRERDIRMGIVAVPADAAQATADRLIEAGALGILNFAPCVLNVGDEVSVVSVDFSTALEQLAFAVSLGLPVGLVAAPDAPE